MSQTIERPMSTDIAAEKQPYPAAQSKMQRQPQSSLAAYRPADKLRGKRALITGGDSGIGRAVAVAFAKEGADVAIFFNENVDDAHETHRLVEAEGRRCIVIRGDVRESKQCKAAVAQTVDDLGGIDILVNNAAFQMAHEKFEDIPEEDFRRTFETNIFGYFHMAQAVLPHFVDGGVIVNTGSIVGVVGNQILVDYASSKGAIHAFTKSLAMSLADRNIRVNCVLPGPVWTPNIPGTMPADEVEHFGHEVAMKRPGQPDELAPVYVMLASDDGSFMTGSLVEVTGGKLG